MMREMNDPAHPRLTSLSLANFRSIGEAQELRIERDLTILAGRNNVGKTAFLHAMTLPTDQKPGVHAGFRMLLKWLVPGDQVRSALRTDEWSIPDITDRLQSKPAFEFTLTIEQAQAADQLPMGQQIVPGDSQMNAFQLSELSIDGDLFKFSRKRNPNQNVGTFTWADGTAPGLFAVPALPSAAFQLCWTLLNSIFYVGPRRTGAPQVLLTNASDLAPDGSNLTNVLMNLSANRRHDVFPLVENFIKDAFPEIAHVDVRLFQTLNQPQAEVYILYPGNSPASEVPLQYCGTGIEQLLMLGAAILGSPTPRVLLIDEPHAFLHPHAERSLIRLMRDHPEHQYIVATHSAVFLRSAQLERVRLLLRGEAGTVVRPFSAEADLLTELGVTASDLWSSDAILWVEGPTEVAIYDVLSEREPDLLGGILVKQMPDAIRAGPAKPSSLGSIEEIVSAVAAALTPLAVTTRFLYDRDEIPESRIVASITASPGAVEFLPCREVENLLLNAEAVTRVLNRRRAQHDLPLISHENVAGRLDALLARVNDADLYPPGCAVADPLRVRGSRVLHRLFASFDAMEYDKVRDGRALAGEVVVVDPAALGPLRDAAGRALNGAPSDHVSDESDVAARTS